MLLADILEVPDRTQALLWDMDGVLIDSLGLDHEICSKLLRRHCGADRIVPASVIREGFALCPHDFWRFIVDQLEIRIAPDDLDRLVEEYEEARRNGHFPILEGVVAIMAAAQAAGLKQAVVSNNARQDVASILTRSGIVGRFDLVVGNDHSQFAKKPAPDTYLHAAAALAVDITRCVVLEDSLVGVEAGCRAGAYTVGVATGGTTLTELERSGYAAVCYSRFEKRQLEIEFGDVRDKRLNTPNDFVSHMIEHIAWRLGVRVYLVWPNTDWEELGRVLGERIRGFEARQRQAAALGMIDDGSAEVFIDLEAEAACVVEAIPNTDLDWFVSLRCEQLDSGRPLIDLLRGLSIGIDGGLRVRVCSVEDPHHSWEGIFRAVGIALSRLYVPMIPRALETSVTGTPLQAGGPSAAQGQGRIHVRASSTEYASVERETAESVVSVNVALSGNPKANAVLAVADTIDVQSFPQLLDVFAVAAGLDLHISFTATKLNSSHVVLEDIGLVLGRALLEIFLQRMEGFGVHGAGSSLKTEADFNQGDVHVGVSIEGRKFIKFVPFESSNQSLRKEFLNGPLIMGTTRAEDLDDFLDGLAGGLSCSIIAHLRQLRDAEAGWIAIFRCLGEAIRECLELNPYRRGLPAGVKATLV